MFHQKPLLGKLPLWTPNPAGIPAPVGAWVMNEGSGNKIWDLSWNRNNADSTDAPAWELGALHFNGSSNYLKTDKDVADGLTEMTVCAWVKADVADTGVMPIVTECPSFFLGRHAGEQYRFGIYNAASDINIYGTRIYADTNWHFIVGRYDSSLASANLRIFVDGIVDGAGGNLTGAIRSNASFKLDIGRWAESGFWDGFIKTVIIYSKALTSVQIAYLYQHPYYAWEYPETWELYAAAAGEISIPVDIDALVQKTDVTSTASLNALIKKTISTSLSLDALLQTSIPIIVSIDGIIKTIDEIISASLDANIQDVNILKTFSIDALLQQLGISSTLSLDVLIKKEGLYQNISLDAILVGVAGTISTNLDALIKKYGIVFQTNIDALISKSKTATTALDALILKTITQQLYFDAILYVQKTASTTMDSYISKLQSIGTNLDAVIAGLGIETELDALISQLNNIETVSLDALILEEGKVTTISLDSIIYETLAYTINLDGIINKAGIISTTYLDAIIYAALTEAVAKYTFRIAAPQSFRIAAPQSFRV